MKNRWLLSVAALLGSCGGPDVRETKISDIDFSDQAAIQKVAQELEPRDRQHFDFYVFRRTAGVGMGGTEITRSDGKAPETVGEAVDLAETTKAAADQRIAEWKELIAKRNSLIKRRNSLLGPDSSLPPQNKAEFDRVEKEIAAVQVEIEKQH
ncbi:MAG TPA: hypothetical protein VGR19_00400 [Allosphingosinicella sp.]|nr:hypothetical protein [Allosphingosinicella sp.]